MGATTFRTTAVGKTPQAAFQTARDNAAWEHGHGGYTGTIAEKGDFALVDVPKRMAAKRFINLVMDAEMHDGNGGAEIRERLRYGTLTVTQRARIEREAAKADRDDARFWRLVPPAARPAIQAASRIASDKWGPAVCIELRGREAAEAKARAGRAGTRDRVFVFFGWASC